MNKSKVKICICQLNTAVGDIRENTSAILLKAQEAADNGAEIIVFPELTITGYPPEDLLLKKKFINDNIKAMKAAARKIKGITAVIGFVEREDGINYNSAAVVSNGKISGIYRKTLLPNYGVFDEKRYFGHGNKNFIFKVRGISFAVTVCEDIWYKNPVLEKTKGKTDWIINISASPYHMGKGMERVRVFSKMAKNYKAGIIYANLCGGQDELVFDGHSLVIDKKGKLIMQAAQFNEDMVYFYSEKDSAVKDKNSAVKSRLSREEEIYRALVTGTKDYIRKNGFKKVIVALSGGIDSAIVSLIAAEAAGKENVTLIFLPTKYSSQESLTDAKAMAENIGIKLQVLAIQDIADLYNKKLQGLFVGMQPDITEENLQARIRGNIVMAMSNKFHALVLTTGNKSEMSTGYATLYGDMAGGFAVIKDVPKTIVYDLCRHINKKNGREVIPANIIKKAPTAELKFNQKDQDTLPPYPVLDSIIKDYVENDMTYVELKNKYDQQILKKVLRMIDLAEYKRRQAPPGVKITPKSFGRDRRMPITNKYRE
ncbi:MAG: NAD+ synthase [Candidatus Goldiibacteriota bacterium HGW-Goldbacteria-1]|jgi:NAD+ synthase (glutamine-hydrolysing)|nr:MAG: NAD+ synthase [Candidatus Goldiibacteriota bacterium HGW-Goldbacteria-1]